MSHSQVPYFLHNCQKFISIFYIPYKKFASTTIPLYTQDASNYHLSCNFLMIRNRDFYQKSVWVTESDNGYLGMILFSVRSAMLELFCLLDAGWTHLMSSSWLTQVISIGYSLTCSPFFFAMLRELVTLVYPLQASLFLIFN